MGLEELRINEFYRLKNVDSPELRSGQTHYRGVGVAGPARGHLYE